MVRASGAVLLQAVAERILAAYLAQAGYADVVMLNSRHEAQTSSGIDIAYRYQGRRVGIKVKPDSYFGTDPSKVRERELVFYRSDAGHYAFESISNHMTREPGWMFNSEADEVYYYYLALSQSEDEIRALLSEPDDVFFGELKVERDELRMLPMPQTRSWFMSHFEEYTPRPVQLGDHSAWYRLIPRADIDGSVEGIKSVSGVFASIAT